MCHYKQNISVEVKQNETRHHIAVHSTVKRTVLSASSHLSRFQFPNSVCVCVQRAKSSPYKQSISAFK